MYFRRYDRAQPQLWNHVLASLISVLYHWMSRDTQRGDTFTQLDTEVVAETMEKA